MTGTEWEPEWTPAEAYCTFACIAIEVDGMVGAEEHAALLERLSRSPALAGQDLEALIAGAHARIVASGEEGAMLAAGAALPAALREEAFRTAVVLTWSDDDSDPREQGFLHRAAEAMGLSTDRRDALMTRP